MRHPDAQEKGVFAEKPPPPTMRAPDPSTRLPTPLRCGDRSIEQSGTAGGTAARRDGVRVFEEFSWLEVGSVTVALSRPTLWLSW